jgi:hypothetical protein
LRKADIREPEMLHSNEEKREMRSLKVAQGGRVGRDGLVMLSLVGVRVGEGDPRGSEPGVYQY